MATKIILKKSNTAGAVPLTTDLEIGEVAVNLADRKLYSKNNSGVVVPLGAAYVGGTAPTGPAEGDLWYDSTNDLLKAYNGTAWQNIYNHPTQTAINVNATDDGTTVIDSVVVDTLGHVTSVGTRTLSNATTSAAGVMSAADKTKLDGIATGAEVNQNAFSNVAVSGQTTVSADGKADTLTLASGTGITITTNATTDTVTISNSAPDQTVAIASGSGITVSGTYPNFTVDHTDTSTQASVDNTGAAVIQDVTLDGFGHVTGLASVTITPALIGASATGHTHTASNITDFNEAAQDAVGTIMSGSGIATVTYNDVANTITVTATEADTLASVTGRGATTTTAVSITNSTASSSTTTGALTVTGGVGIGGNVNIGGNTIITGDLTVNGTTITVNSNTVNIGDNIIILNADETGVPSQNAGFEVERGTSVNVQFIWNETADAWDMGDQTLQNVRIDGGTY